MARISGKEAVLAIVSSSTWDTEGTTDKLVAFDSFDPGISHTEEQGQSLNGLGQVMAEDIERGITTYAPSVTLKIRSQGNWEYLLAQLLGTSGVPTEQTGSQSDYLHTLTLSETVPSTYFTMALKDTSGTTLTYPTVAINSVTITIPTKGPMVATFNMIAGSADLSSSTNTQAVLDAIGAPTTIPVVADQDDEFLVNAQAGGALSNSTDCVNVSGLTINLSRPLQSIPEIKCVAGNSEPVDGGEITATINVTEIAQTDHTILQRGDDGDFIKASFENQSETQIGTGLNHSVKFYLPKGKIVDQPVHSINSPGFNEFSYTYRGLKAASSPTGMSSTYPYFELVNTISTSLLA